MRSPSRCGQRPRRGRGGHRVRRASSEQQVDGVVVVVRVVVEQRQALGPRPRPPRARRSRRCSGPSGLRRELGLGVLGVVDQQVGAVAQLEHDVGSTWRAVDGLLVVADVGDGRRRRARSGSRSVVPMWGTWAAVTVAPSRSIERPAFEGRGSGCSPGRSAGRTGKNGGRMNSSKASARPTPVVGRAVDVEAGSRRAARREEREALDVVPVEVGDQGVGRGRARRAARSRRRTAGRCRGRARSARARAPRARRRRCCPRSGGCASHGHGVEPRTPKKVTFNRASPRVLRLRVRERSVIGGSSRPGEPAV